MKNSKIAVIGGAGHVGLPLSLLLSSLKFQVSIHDIDESKLSLLKKKIFPFEEEGIKKFKKELDKMFFFSDYSNLKNNHTIIVTTGTPVDEHLNPNFDYIFKTFNLLIPYLKNGQNLILRSTLFPGTTNLIEDMLIKNNLKLNISFCPERIAQGKAFKELRSLPQIISGNNRKAIENSEKIFKLITKKIIKLPIVEAELTKLFNNAWRYLKFSIANQFYQISVNKGLDFNIIRRAMTEGYYRANDFPKSGFAAGPCLFKDTMQLASFSRQEFTLGHSAMLVNETMPEFLVDKVKAKHNLKNKKIGILGMAFKPDSDDKRESLAYKLKKILIIEGADVSCTDIYIKDKTFKSLSYIKKNCSIVFIGCPHSEYKDIKFSKKIDVIDCWGFLNK